MRRFDPVSHVRKGLAAWAVAVALAVVLAPVVAASTPVTYAISGVEYAATSVQGKFAGGAVATDDYGTWLAVIDHTVLSTSGGATIIGGTFSYDGKVRDIAGTFNNTGGTLTQTGGFTGCVNETFAVAGTLALVVPAGGTGSFSAKLTHYRTMLFGSCRTYAATVKGSVAFTLP